MSMWYKVKFESLKMLDFPYSKIWSQFSFNRRRMVFYDTPSHTYFIMCAGQCRCAQTAWISFLNRKRSQVLSAVQPSICDIIPNTQKTTKPGYYRRERLRDSPSRLVPTSPGPEHSQIKIDSERACERWRAQLWSSSICINLNSLKLGCATCFMESKNSHLSRNKGNQWASSHTPRSHMVKKWRC